MTHEQVDARLRDYKRCVGRCAHLDLEIDALKKQRGTVYERIVDEAAYASASPPGETPHDQTISKPTEQGAVRIENDLRAEYARIDDRIAELEAELGQLQLTVLFVDAWVSGLTEREKWVITRCVLDGEYLRSAAAEWNALHGTALNKRHMQRIKNEALLKVYEMAQ